MNLCQNNLSNNATVSHKNIVRRNLSLLLFLHLKISSILVAHFFHFKLLYVFHSLLSLIPSPIHSFMFFKEINYSLYLTVHHFVLLQCLLKAQFFQEVFLQKQKISLKMSC